ncbi:autophagy-related protein 101 isoform X4 [Varanus komodoensis]|uniref:autophagy-related protein 101 isoform X4 n=1 Tax=Varanus komodoensis TaxID=61221 RepID=UPI001CF7A1EE|nr:autophagy-related protein 101 isoform X4 [Varanus komodoensis]
MSLIEIATLLIVLLYERAPYLFSFAKAKMNCRSEVLEISVEGRQIEEAMLAVLHTILLHRSTGKFHYKKEGTYSIGTVGTQDVDCDFIDFTYVRVTSEELDRALRKAVGEFKDALRNSGNDGMGQISLEFYQKKKSRWPFSDECIPWEVWMVKVNVGRHHQTQGEWEGNSTCSALE